MLALACACLTWAFADNASANAPIISFSAIPSSTQAGGHPDVEVALRSRKPGPQKSQSPCNCEDAKDADIHLPAGLHRQPPRDPAVHGRPVLRRRMPDRLAGRDRRTCSRRTASPSTPPSTTSMPPPEDAGLLGFKIFLFDTPQFTVLGARTGGDYGLDADTTSIFHGLFPLEALQQVLWGVPADPDPRPRCGSTRATPSAGRRSPAPSATRAASSPPPTRTRRRTLHRELRRLHPAALQRAQRPVPAEPDHLRHHALLDARSPLLRRRPDQRRSTRGRR